MTPEEALILLVQADPNRSYTVSRHDSAHVPALAGNPPNLRTTWDVSCNPGIGPSEWLASGAFGYDSLGFAVSALLSKLEREKARQTLAMAMHECPKCGAPDWVAISAELATPSETKPHNESIG